MENMVYLELCRRGYDVDIGKTPDGDRECFIQYGNEKVKYISARLTIHILNVKI